MLRVGYLVKAPGRRAEDVAIARQLELDVGGLPDIRNWKRGSEV